MTSYSNLYVQKVLPSIQFKLLNLGDGDGFLSYQLTLSNGEATTSFAFYGYDDEFKAFAEQLSSFPQSINQVVCHQIGSDDVDWAYFLQLEVFCYEPNGNSAIRVRGWTGKQIPYYQRFEFFIQTLPAALNRLGQTLRGWNPLERDEFTWFAS